MIKYELFAIKPYEAIRDILNRFSNMVNKLESLGKYISSEEQVPKILSSLPQNKWMVKVIILQETKDFTKFNLEQLPGSLLTHELQLGTQYDESSTNNQALTLKVDKEEEREEDFDIEETMKLVRKFKKMKKKIEIEQNQR